MGRRLLALTPLLSLVLAVPAPDDGLLLHYRLDETGATSVAVDSSGHGRDGTVVGAAGWTGAQGLRFDGTSTYVQAPPNLLTGLDAITVAFDVAVDPAQGTPYFLYGFGIDEFGGRGYVPFETTDLSAGAWTVSADYALPARPRHGTVLPVTAAEYRALLTAYSPDHA